MKEDEDSNWKLERLLYLVLAFGRYPPKRSGARSSTEQVALTNLVRVGDRKKKNSRPTGTHSDT